MLETLLSVIIPVYNVEPYLEQCLDSVTNQTYKNMEIICVNDGSTDNSLKILQKYKLKDPRIKVISQQNKGTSEARNVGVNVAKGKYIGFIDPDDYIEPTMYEKLMTPMLMDPSIDFSATGIWLEYEDGSHPPKKQTLLLSGKNRTFMNLKVGYGFVWNKVYKSEIIKERGIDSPKGIYHQDYAFSFAYLAHSKYAYYIQDSLYHYRKRKNSICESIKHIEHMPRRIDKIKACLYFYEYLKRFDLSNRYKKYVFIQINEHIKFVLKQANSTRGSTLRVKWELAKQIFEICKWYDFTFNQKLSFWIAFAKNLFAKDHFKKRNSSSVNKLPTKFFPKMREENT